MSRFFRIENVIFFITPRFMVKLPYMDTEDLKQLIAKSGLSDRRISLNCGEREDFVSDIKKGIKPAFDSVFRLLKVLGYEVHLISNDGRDAAPPREAKSWQTPPYLPASEGAGEAAPGLEPVRDRQIAIVKLPYMDTEDLKELIAKSGLSDRRISLNCGERHNFVNDIKKGIKPAFDSVFRLLKVLGYEVHLSLNDGGGAGDAAPGLEPVRDRQLAEVLAALVEHYERENDYGRRCLIKEIKAHCPWLFRARKDEGGPADPGRRASQGNSRDGFPGER